MTSIPESRPKRPHSPRADDAATLEAATATLVSSLDEGHPYRDFAEGSYRPACATDDSRWSLARQAVLAILAADVPHVAGDLHYAAARRNTLCTMAYWAARDGAEALVPDVLLDEETIQRFVAADDQVLDAVAVEDLDHPGQIGLRRSLPGPSPSWPAIPAWLPANV